MARSRLRGASSVLVVALLATACGSTVQVGGGQAVVGSGEPAPATALDGLGTPTGRSTAPNPGGPGGAGDPSATGPSALPPGRSSGSPGPGSSTTPAEGTLPPAGTTTPPPGSGATPATAFPVASGTPGVTDDQIFIGLVYAENANAGNEAIGFGEITRGDARRYYDLMVERVNAAGGIAGRELVPVFHVADGASNESTASVEEQICATWTQDNEVFVAVIASATDVLRQCLDNAGVALIVGQGLGVSDSRTYERFPRVVEPTNLSLDPMARLTVDGLAAQGYFDPPSAVTPTRVGIITYDFPTFRRVTESQLLPALDAAGVAYDPPVYVKYPERQSDAGELSAQLANTVLRFNTSQVSHVIIFEYNALITLLFLNAAEPQGYRPRYGFNSQNGGQLLVGLVPDQQLRGALSVGWFPAIDTVDPPRTPAVDRCVEIYESEGITFDSPNAQLVGMVICDTFQVLPLAVASAPSPLSRDALLEGFSRLGTRFESAVVQQVRLEPGRRFGVAGYHHSAFDARCRCFQYTAGPFSIP